MGFLSTQISIHLSIFGTTYPKQGRGEPRAYPGELGARCGGHQVHCSVKIFLAESIFIVTYIFIFKIIQSLYFWFY